MLGTLLRRQDNNIGRESCGSEERRLRRFSAPFIPTHTIERFQQLVENIKRERVLKKLLWGYFNGELLKTEDNGARHILVQFFCEDKSTKDVILIISRSDDLRKEFVMKTVLTHDHFCANNEMTEVQHDRGKKRKSGRTFRFDPEEYS